VSKTIYVPITGGLGNQLFQIAAGMSETQGKVVVLTCLGNPRSTDNKPDSQHMNFPNRVLFNQCKGRHSLSAKFFNLLISTTGRRSFINKRKVLKILIELLSSVVFSTHFLTPLMVKTGIGIGFDQAFKRKKGNFIVGYFQSYRFLEDSNSQEEFRSIECLSKRPPYLKLLNTVRSTPSTMLHVRLGDYHQEKSFGVLSEKYFDRALSEIESGSKNSRLLMFSDEPEEATQLFSIDVQYRLTTIPSNFLTPAETLEIMKNCTKFVTSNSSFSWWAAYLSSPKPSLVIYPTPWFTGINEPQNLIPESWIGIARN
jgi:hypothetical protein